MKTMLSTCGCSIAHAKFSHKKQVATHRPLQHMREAKVIHMSKVVSSPMYSTTLISGNKLLENRLGSQFLSSSNYPSSCFQLRSYSSNSRSSNNLLTDQDPPEPDFKGPYWPLPDVAMIVVSGIVVALDFGGHFKQSTPYLLFKGLLFVISVQRLVCFLYDLYWLLKKPSVNGGNGKVTRKKSIAQCLNSANKIPFIVNNKTVVHMISSDVNFMLHTQPSVLRVFEEKYSSYTDSVEGLHAEVIFGCKLDIKPSELSVREHSMILKAVRIIREHGAEPDSSSVHY